VATTLPSNVVPLAYSERSIARRFGIMAKTLRRLIVDDDVPVFAKDGAVRVPRGYATGYDCRYNTNGAWSDTQRPA
jgi:hypothetical protein